MHAFPVLAQRVLRLAGPGKQQHQHAVRGLVQGIVGQQALRLFDGLEQAAFEGQPAHQPLQCCHQGAAQALGFDGLPLVEGHAVAQAEAGQEIALNQRRGRQQRRQAGRADLVLVVSVAVAFRHQTLEVAHVAPQLGVGRQRHRLPLQGQPAARRCRSRRLDRVRRSAARALALARVRIEQSGQCIAAVALAGDRQVGQQRGRLAGVQGHRPIIPCDVRWSEEVQVEHGEILPSKRQKRNDMGLVTGFVTLSGRLHGRMSQI
jgi:hypothetical protein